MDGLQDSHVRDEVKIGCDAHSLVEQNGERAHVGAERERKDGLNQCPPRDKKRQRQVGEVVIAEVSLKSSLVESDKNSRIPIGSQRLRCFSGIFTGVPANS